MLVVDKEKVTARILELKSSYKQIGALCGLATSTIARLSQRGGITRIKTLGKLATALKVDYRALLKGD